MKKDEGAESLGKALVVLCGAALLAIYFSGWRGEEAGVAFVIALFILCVAAIG
jgi:ABC-type uncharacterized transport system permease subunit